MRRLLFLLGAVLLTACTGAGPGAGSAGAPSVAGSEPAASVDAGGSSGPSAEASVPAPSAAASSESGGALPAGCAEGFGAYLTAIEPIVADFDPATATLRSLADLEQVVHEKEIELLDANDSRATYDCTAIGLEWAYFDASSPWDAVLAFADEMAPGAVAYLTAVRDLAAIDVAKVTDYGVDGCDVAVAAIKDAVAAAGGAIAGELPLADGLRILGLYKAYLTDVRNELCPRDELGNDEFDFFRGVD